MRRNTRSTPTDRISLFPFLAVLICTMGALLVLLVIMSQHAQAKAAQEQAQVSEEDLAAAQRELEDVRMWTEQWQAMRENTEKELDRRRAELANVEDHMRRLRAKLDELKAAQEKLDDQGAGGLPRIDELKQKLERLRAELAEAQRKLDEALKNKTKEVSYAVVPYDGPHETRRRPIYLECRKDAVILQPEGIRLEERDFVPPLGPANPLVSAIRAASSHWAGLAAQGYDVGRPYPLLLVRADGIEAYYAARGAMKSWESDFGYELIGNDLQLEFSTPDTRLADAAEQAVEAARRRRERQAARGLGGAGGGDGDSPFGKRRAKNGGIGRRGDGTSDPSGGDSETSDSPHGDLVQGDLAHDGGREKPPMAGTPAGEEGTANRYVPSPTTPPSSSSPAKNAQGADVKSIADSRGKDWASPGASKGLIPFTRTMIVQVAADRLIIQSQDPSIPASTVMMPDSTKAGVEEFVSKVWEEMKSWGSAGRGMYWRPELNLQVHPGGERRVQELQVLLKDSGLDLAPTAR